MCQNLLLLALDNQRIELGIYWNELQRSSRHWHAVWFFFGKSKSGKSIFFSVNQNYFLFLHFSSPNLS